MSGLLSQPVRGDPNWVEAEVMSVDAKRGFCEVKTIHGQKLTSVKWLCTSGGSSRAGDYGTPTVGDQVVISLTLTYPVIFGYLPRVNEGNIGAVSIDTGIAVGDTGNLSTSQGPGIGFAPGKPEDMVAGDRVIVSEGGGFLALLRMGTVILRSSRLAQIVLSKFDDLIRIVGRNLEVFTDSHTEVSHNLRGRVYRFIGLSKTHPEVRTDNFTYQEIYGDTAAGEYSKQDFLTSGIPVANSTLRKIKVLSGSTEVYSGILREDGHLTETVVHSGTATRDHDGGQIQDTVSNGGTSTITLNGTSITLSQDGSSTATLTGSTIVLNHGSASVTLNNTGVYIVYGSHYINVTSTGVNTG